MVGCDYLLSVGFVIVVGNRARQGRPRQRAGCSSELPQLLRADFVDDLSAHRGSATREGSASMKARKKKEGPQVTFPCPSPRLHRIPFVGFASLALVATPSLANRFQAPAQLWFGPGRISWDPIRILYPPHTLSRCTSRNSGKTRAIYESRPGPIAGHAMAAARRLHFEAISRA